MTKRRQVLRDLSRAAETVNQVRKTISSVEEEISFRYREIEILRDIDSYILESDSPERLESPKIVTQLFEDVMVYINSALVIDAECGFYVNLDNKFELLGANNSPDFPRAISCELSNSDWKKIEKAPLHSEPGGQPFTGVFSNAQDVYTEPLFIFDNHLLGVFVVQGASDTPSGRSRWLKDTEHVETLRGVFRQLKIAYRFLVEHRRSAKLNELWTDFSERYFSPHLCLSLLAKQIVSMQPDFGPLKFKSQPNVQILFPYGEELRILATTGWERDIETVAIQDSICGLAFREGRRLNIDPTSDDYAHLYKQYFGTNGEIRSELVVPMWVKDSVVGVVNFECPEQNAFTATQERTLAEIVKRVTPVALSLKARLDHNREAQSAYSAILSDYLMRFSGVLRHELATPTSGLATSLDTAIKRIDTVGFDVDEIREDLVTAEENRKYIDRSVFSFIKDLSKYGEVEPTCINELVRETVEIINDTYDASIGGTSGQECDFTIRTQEIGRYRVRASRLLKPYLVCLFDNSIRSISAKKEAGLSKRKGVIIVTISSDEEHPDLINLTIKDNGLGISRRELLQLRRFQFGTRFRQDKGQGYGLAATQRYLSEVGGWIDIDSSKGRSFTVKLRLKHEK